VQDISLHILDVVENGINAGASTIQILITGDRSEDELTLRIIDDGRGMSPRELARARDPFYTTKPGKSVGLGLSLLGQAAVESGGVMTVDSEPNQGTEICARFHPSHPDCKPLGDVRGTVEMLRITHPEIMFVYESDFE
jgi:signal transduction histidine kinase